MYSVQNGGVDPPIASVRNQPTTPQVERTACSETGQRGSAKRHRSYASPPTFTQSSAYDSISSKPHSASQIEHNTKISFSPFVLKFKADQKASIKEITDDLCTFWKQQHGSDLAITARFGHMQSLLIFTDDSSTFESLLIPTHWPRSLKDVEVEVRDQRQLPPEYSLVIQQFHRNWDENEWLTEMQTRYASLSKITRLRVKEGSPLNAVRADFKSMEEVRRIIHHGKIYVGSMIHPVKQYRLPLRINKCMRCLRHDHATKSCSQPRLCPRCASAHPMDTGCSNDVKCANCGGDHYSGNSACPIVQERRVTLQENAKKHRAELLVMADQQQRHYEPYRQNEQRDQPANSVPPRPENQPGRSYAQVAQVSHARDQQQSLDLSLSSFLEKMDHRLDQFASRLSSQLCEIEKKANRCLDRQANLEQLLYVVVMPTFQDLTQVLMQSSRSQSFQESASKFSAKLNAIIEGHRTQHERGELNLPASQCDEHNDNGLRKQ